MGVCLGSLQLVFLSGLGPVFHAGEFAYQLLGLALLGGHLLGYRLAPGLAQLLSPLCVCAPALIIGLRNLSGLDSETNSPITLLTAFALAIIATAPLAQLILRLWSELEGEREQLVRLYAQELLGSAVGLLLAALAGPMGLMRLFPFLAALAFRLYARWCWWICLPLAVLQLIWLPRWLAYQALLSHRVLPEPKLLGLSLSAYQLVEVVESQGKRYLFLNGLCHHDPEHLQALNFYLSSLPASILDPGCQARGALVLGGGALLSASELRRLGWETTVVELDPEVLRLSSEYFAPLFQLNLSDPKLHLVCNDARAVLRSDQQYGLIVFSLPYPYSLNVASLFSEEYFQGLRAHLAPGGAVSVFLGAPAGRAELDPVAASILHSLRKVFPNTLVISSREMANSVVLCRSEMTWDRGAAARVALAAGYRRFHFLSESVQQQICRSAPPASLWDLSFCARLNRDLWRN